MFTDRVIAAWAEREIEFYAHREGMTKEEGIKCIQSSIQNPNRKPEDIKETWLWDKYEERTAFYVTLHISRERLDKAVLSLKA